MKKHCASSTSRRANSRRGGATVPATEGHRELGKSHGKVPGLTAKLGRAVLRTGAETGAEGEADKTGSADGSWEALIILTQRGADLPARSTFVGGVRCSHADHGSHRQLMQA